MFLPNENIVLADVLARHHALIPVLNRFGIRLGVADKTLGELCREHSLNTDFVLTVLNVYLDENYVPDDSLALFDAALVTDYFRHTVENYIHDLVPNIEKHLNAFIALSSAHNSELGMLRVLFHKFKEKLTEHLQNGINHNDDFPYELLHDLKIILIKHVSPESNQNLCHAVIFSISSLENDLAMHNRLLNRILRPKLNGMNSQDIQYLQDAFADEQVAGTEKNQLTKREIEILKLIVQGLLNKEIADKLSISLNTVLTHRKNIIAKTGIKTVSGLTFYCISNGYVLPDENVI